MKNKPTASTVTLPQIRFTADIHHDKQYLLAIGGRAPSSEWLREASEQRTLWAVDRGLDSLLSAGLTPELLIGDGDSASPEAWQKAVSAQIPTERFPSEKDFTDTDLALKKIKAENPSAFIVMTGGFGGRFDHAFTTIYSFALSGIAGCIADDKECLLFANGPSELEITCLRRPSAISLLPLSGEAHGVSFSGVHWPLENASLCQSKTLTVSNRLTEDTNVCRLRLSKGLLGVYFVWDESGL